MKRQIILGLLFLAVVSCTKEATDGIRKIKIGDDGPQIEKVDTVMFHAYMPCEFSKTSLYYASNRVSWNLGDEVLITDGENSSVYTAVKYGKRDSTILDFDYGSFLKNTLGTVYTAYYPQDLAQNVLPEAIEYYGPDRTLSVPMMAKTTRGSSKEAGRSVENLQFKYLTGALKINIVSAKAAIKLSMTRIDVSSDKPLSGPATITWGESPSISLSGNAGAYINCSKFLFYTGSSANDVMPICVYPPEGEYHNLSIVLTDTKKKKHTASYTGTINIKRGEVTTIKVDLAK